MKPSRRDPLRELHQLLRVPEEGACNLGAFLFEHAEELAPALGSTADDLRASAGLPDEVVARRLRARLSRRREIDKEQKALEDSQVAMRAAAALGASVRWTEHGAVLDTDLLLGDVLANRETKSTSRSRGPTSRLPSSATRSHARRPSGVFLSTRLRAWMPWGFTCDGAEVAAATTGSRSSSHRPTGCVSSRSNCWRLRRERQSPALVRGSGMCSHEMGYAL